MWEDFVGEDKMGRVTSMGANGWNPKQTLQGLWPMELFRALFAFMNRLGGTAIYFYFCTGSRNLTLTALHPSRWSAACLDPTTIAETWMESEPEEKYVCY